MAKEHVFQVLFFLQSVSFILYIMNNTQQQSTIIRAPIKKTECPRHVCKCEENEIGPTVTMHPVKKPTLTNCSLDDIKKRPGVVLLTTTNAGYLDITLNMFESIKRTGMCVNTTIIAEDKRVFAYLSKRTEGDPTVTVLLTNSGETRSGVMSRKDRRGYSGFLNKREAYVLNLLEHGYEVIFSDADTFWFQNALPYFQGEFDISMVDATDAYPNRTSKSSFCAGFVYFKPTNATIHFVKTWIGIMKNNEKKGIAKIDQTVMNSLLSHNKPIHMNVKLLDPRRFPWGPKFYRILAAEPNYSSAVVMHAASIRGHDEKIAKFNSSNMWLLNRTNKELLAEGR